ncbi:MAG TPA: DUF4340 domain-containing protein, partial [Myxococcaceae bacterium]|nr:DUF4340 domain-containing protein [Myxococcaceae bacterium]
MTQLQKNLAGLGVLVAVVAALGLYAYFGVMKTEEREAQRKEVSEKLFAPHGAADKLQDGGLPPAAVFTSIVVKAKGDVTMLEKKGSDWWIASPLNARADKSAVDQLISQLQNARVKATIEENPSEADLTKYGLDQPRFTVTAYAYLPDGKDEGTQDPARRREVNLYGGIENTFDGSSYLRRGNEKPVYAVDGSAKLALEKSTFDLRDKEVLAIDEPSVKQIDFKSKANRYLLGRGEGNAWQLKTPKQGPADATAVTSMLSAMRNDRAIAFATDSPEERKRTGINSPAAEVTFTPASGDPIRIRFGKAKVGTDEKAFALRESGQESVLAEVPLAAVSALDKSPLDLRDKAVLAFNRDDVGRISLSPGGAEPEIVVQKSVADAGSNQEWTVTAPTTAPAKKWTLSSALFSLAGLKATSIDDENPKDWGKYGISASSRAVTLADKDGKVLARLEVGKEVKGKANTLCARGSRNAVLEIDSAKISELPSKLSDVIEPQAQGADG